MEILSPEQRRQWQVDGYLHLEQVFEPEEVGFYCDQMDRFRKLPGYEPDRRPELPIGHYSWMDHTPDLDPDGFMDRRELLTYHQAFVDLVDRAPVFDYIVDIMGPHILLSMTQAIVRHSGEDSHCYTHTDGGESLRLFRVSESSPPIAMKAMYLLTDVTEPDSGNLTVFPGSHMRPIPVPGERTITPYSPGPRSSWAGPATSTCSRTRFGTDQAGTCRGAAAAACSTTTASSGCGATTTTPFRTWPNGARRDNGACSATSATTSCRGRTSTCRRTRRT